MFVHGILQGREIEQLCPCPHGSSDRTKTLTGDPKHLSMDKWTELGTSSFLPLNGHFSSKRWPKILECFLHLCNKEFNKFDPSFWACQIVCSSGTWRWVRLTGFPGKEGATDFEPVLSVRFLYCFK